MTDTLQTGEIPLDELYDTLNTYRKEHADYVEAFLRARLDYESVNESPGLVVVEGPIDHVAGGEFLWWLGVRDERRDREVALELEHDQGGDWQWSVVNDSGRLLGYLRAVEVGIDV